jgi:hypothetical protein
MPVSGFWECLDLPERLPAYASLPSVVIGCRRFVLAEAIAAMIKSSATSASPSQDAVRSRRVRRRRRSALFVEVAAKRQVSESALALMAICALFDSDVPDLPPKT